MSTTANTKTPDTTTEQPRTAREVIAENVLLLIEQLEAGHSDYIHLYHGNASLLAESLEVIQKTAAVILAALELPVGEVNDTAATEAPELGEVAA
jgi:hypothetical protein